MSFFHSGQRVRGVASKSYAAGACGALMAWERQLALRVLADTQMWNKQKEEPAAVRPPSEPVRSTAPTPISSAPAASAAVNPPAPPAVIGRSMTIIGDIRAAQELVVEGEVDGVLESQSMLTVGPNGKVKGNIKA